MKSNLNSIENAIHFSVWSIACLYSLYELIRAQTDVLGGFNNLEYTLRDLNSGWRFIRRLKDESDVEWSTWKYLIRTTCESDEEVFVMLYAVAWVEIRCITFCLDYVDKVEKLEFAENEKYVELSASKQFVNMFSYVLYLPVLFVGPIIDYEAFENSFHVQNQNLRDRLKRFIWNMALYAIYTLLLEFAFHYIYFIAMQSNLKVITLLPSSALCGGGLWMGLEFHLKYVISYGTTTSFARLDNIDPPPTPRCIARIHVYSQMWRYFDVGLYRFLFKYIYTPVYNTIKYYVTMNKMIYKLISSLVTFMFIFTWHGTDIGNLYFGLFKSPSLYNCAMAYIALYCCCHVAIALKNVPSRTDVKEIDSKTVFHRHID
ncbi:unnamed protein product [Arctia plantaginis]|uniref:Protein-cysteine N-palmitoyltransferase Rasp n=1 Tax=Arctia plantaginis TaxID=874455 RepID=A0A8S1BDZ5_ARCPL|nr:unnamed protein product [Arctia plantaginis]